MISIETEDVDNEMFKDLDKVSPYEKTIQHMKGLLERTSCPMQKILDLAENRKVLTAELNEYQTENRLGNKIAG